MNIRATTFWGIDFLRGSEIYRYLREIRTINEKNSYESNQLNYILNYAMSNVKYYSNLKVNELDAFPIVTKLDIINNYDDFTSRDYYRRKTHTMSTSGSTGTPFVIKQNRSKRNRVIAELIYANEQGGQEFGEKYYFVRTTSQGISKLRQIKNNEISLNVSRLDEINMKNILDIMNKDTNVKTVLSYPSTYEELLKYLRRSTVRYDLNVKTLFSSGAIFSLEDKVELSKILECEVLDRYSNQECGLLAQTRTTSGDFIVNRASYRIELLKLYNNDYCEPGELGRIVITDLYNKAMPIIRYDNGDLGVTNDLDTSNVRTLNRIEGRVADIIFDVEGKPVSPHMWTAIMRNFNSLKQWQLIQNTEMTYTLKINLYDDKIDKSKLVNSLLNELGSEAVITLQKVDDIPVLQSGKFKATICEIK